VVVLPAHNVAVPPKEEGAAFTVTICELLHPPKKYDMIVVPNDIPVTIPVDDPTVATVALDDAHVPPPILLVSVMVDGMHTVVGPDIVPIEALTVSTLVAKQPVVLV
jgi:hypothetical protein